jgi:hypothetical protein
LLTLNHRIAHFSGQRLTDFLTFGANLHCTSKSYNSQKRRSLKEKEEALRVIHNGDKTLSSHFHDFTLQSDTGAVGKPYLALAAQPSRRKS